MCLSSFTATYFVRLSWYEWCRVTRSVCITSSFTYSVPVEALTAEELNPRGNRIQNSGVARGR